MSGKIKRGVNMRLIDAEALLKEYEGAFAYKMLKEIVENDVSFNNWKTILSEVM